VSNQNSGGAPSFLTNPNALLALVTLVGGFWLVSRKLTSDRPVSPAGSPKEFVGDQKLESRLWEDPLKTVPPGNNETASDKGADKVVSVSTDLKTLIRQITVRSESSPVLLLPVMISGGQYSEDQESRIRSRYAIVSALGESGYMPEDAEHIGALKIPWPTQEEVERSKGKPSPGSVPLERLWDENLNGNRSGKIRLLGVGPSAQMQVRFEWYRSRVFSSGRSSGSGYDNVLVLWLDDSYFEEDPLLRLPLLLEPLTDPGRYLKDLSPAVALIGPRRSSTLRNMLPKWQPTPIPWADTPNQKLVSLAKAVLGRIDLYAASPSAMDEVLVQKPTNPDYTPRASVRTQLIGEGFSSFHNLAATDAQMAQEVFKELELRGVRLTREKKDAPPPDHIVLISEWDTFYARILSLTYGAELAVKQGDAKSRAEFVDAYISRDDPQDFPKNFHSFVYLRGLDGQTVGKNSNAGEEDADANTSDKTAPISIEEIRHWTPDVNRAEGPAQFDYLGRLGDRMDELQNRLKRESQGEIKAVGIVGSDVYDTLLILQALRKRFPSVLFFTTDLDVRFFNPVERDWARNLIVASAYGLTLQANLQGTIAPFRDSSQTAQYAAALAALGNDKLARVARVPPRLFEIGNRTAVDLSVERCQAPIDHSGPVVLHPPTASDRHGPAPEHDRQRYWLSLASAVLHSNPFILQPPTENEANWLTLPHELRRVGWSMLAAVLVLGGACGLWPPLRRVTWKGLEYLGDALNYSEEDIGGPDGAWAVLRRLELNPDDGIAKWLLRQPGIRQIRAEIEATQTVSADDMSWEREEKLAKLTDLLVTLLNILMRKETDKRDITLPLPSLPRVSDTGTSGLLSAFRHWPQVRQAVERRAARKSLDVFLLRIAPPPTAGDAKKSEIAAASPAVSRRIFGRPLSRFHKSIERAADVILGGEGAGGSPSETGKEDVEAAALLAAASARQAADGIYRLRRRRFICFWLGALVFGWIAYMVATAIWCDTYDRSDGQPFSLISGVSAWPAEVLRLLVFILAVCFSFGLSFKMREAFLVLTRSFRLPFSLEKTAPTSEVCAGAIWEDYRKRSLFRRRLERIGLVMAAFFLLLIAIFFAADESIRMPLRGQEISSINTPVILAAFFGFFFLAFLTMDAACLCRRFIENLSAGPTLYPVATRRHFSRLMGRIDDEYLDEWIDLQLIADLTEKVGSLVYYPTGLLLLLVLARNSWWDCWSWPISLIVVFALNFILALASVVILQRAAKDSKRKAELSLSAKVKKLQAQVAPSPAQNNANQAARLLEEIQQLDRGAFVPFWENPVVGAIFLSSGGTTLLQIFILFMGR
jgi:hypothetical protein